MKIELTSNNRFIIYASDFAVLDSDVYTGGGTDDTEALQNILDKAAELGKIHLIMDGAALVRGLRLHSNTTIECLNKDCGFYLADQSNCAIVTNYDWDFGCIRTRNISLIGGTYNHNCLNQVHDLPIAQSNMTQEEIKNTAFQERKWIFALEFYGIENLNANGITIRNQRTFAFTVGNWRHVNIENVWIDLVDRMHAQNQDGFHFWGPGQFLNMRNIGGYVGDDFMNIGPDELDCCSDITDVLIDGVFLDNADQGIRLLSRGCGRLDRVTIRNVTGTYNSFGFYINPWFPGETYGNFGSIVFENINLCQTAPVYDYTPAFLFRLGGNIESIVFRNITHHHPIDNRSLFQIGLPFYDMEYRHPKREQPVVESMVFDGIHIVENGNSAADAEYIQFYGPINHVIARNVEIIRTNTNLEGSMIVTKEGCDIGVLQIQQAYISRMEQFLLAKQGHIGKLIVHNPVCNSVKNGFVCAQEGVIDITEMA